MILILLVIGIAAGPILTFALIFTTLPLFWINVIGSLVFALLIPFVALGGTFLYFDLQGARGRGSGDAEALLAARGRPRQFGRVVVAPGPAVAPSG